jgi:hypothetical protein
VGVTNFILEWLCKFLPSTRQSSHPNGVDRVAGQDRHPEKQYAWRDQVGADGVPGQSGIVRGETNRKKIVETVLGESDARTGVGEGELLS